MFQSTCNFRICVKEHSQVLPLNIYTSNDSKPVFDELVNKIRKHINLKHYLLVANNKSIIYDDKSLHSALISASGDLEITLQNKSISKESNLPDTIPTVTRWSPVLHPNEIQHNPEDGITCRKDSGVFLDDGSMKKGKVYITNHLRKLPYPTSPTLTNHYNTHFIDSKMANTSPSESSSLSSTSSESYNTTPSFKLPAITTITHSHIEKLDTQLAPIYSLPTFKKRRYNPIKTSTDVHTCHFREETGKVCGLSFRRPYDLSRHKNTHLINRPFSYCEVCGKRFTRRDALRRHERVQGHTSKRQDLKQPLRHCLPQT